MVILRNVPYDAQETDIENALAEYRPVSVRFVRKFGVFQGSVIIKLPSVEMANRAIALEKLQIGIIFLIQAFELLI